MQIVSSPWALSQAEMDAYDADRAADDLSDEEYEAQRAEAFGYYEDWRHGGRTEAEQDRRAEIDFDDWLDGVRSMPERPEHLSAAIYGGFR